MIYDKINKFLSEKFNIMILRGFPRHSTRNAKRHFKGKPIVAIEIGTFEGYNAENLLKELNIKKLYIVDPYEEYKDYTDSEKHRTQSNLSRVEKAARKRLEKYKDRIVWIKKFSNDAVKDIREKVDFIYIDGNHEYEYAKNDLMNYYPLLKKNGIIAGHDVSNFQGVSDAVIEFSHKIKTMPRITRTDFWFTKKHG